jgi:hypothetical protein
MKKKALFKALTRRYLLLRIAIFIILFSYDSGYSQNYRTATAYINDFTKNEIFVKKSLLEYSLAIIEDSPDDRKQTTLERIFTKLEKINTILLRNDRGFEGDTDLRDAFIHLNNKTIALLKNNSLDLNDYDVQSALDYVDIFRNFAYKELEIAKYYEEIAKYEYKVAEFGLKYKIAITTIKKNNVFEYHAYHSLIFYKLNVLDDRLIALLKENDSAAVKKCMDYIVEVGRESLQQTELLRRNFADTSLNDANIEVIKFIMQQKDTVIPFYEQYLKTSSDFQAIKTKFNSNLSDISAEEYNVHVRHYNAIKNNYYKISDENRLKKIILLNKWQTTNSDFLRRNIDFEKF